MGLAFQTAVATGAVAVVVIQGSILMFVLQAHDLFNYLSPYATGGAVRPVFQQFRAASVC